MSLKSAPECRKQNGLPYKLYDRTATLRLVLVREVTNLVVWQKHKISQSAHAVSSFRENKWHLLHPTPSSSCEAHLVRKFFISSYFMNNTTTTDTHRVLPNSVLTRPNTSKAQRLKSLTYFVTLTSKLFTYFENIRDQDAEDSISNQGSCRKHEGWGSFIKRNFIIFTFHQILLG